MQEGEQREKYAVLLDYIMKGVRLRSIYFLSSLLRDSIHKLVNLCLIVTVSKRVGVEIKLSRQLLLQLTDFALHIYFSLSQLAFSLN